MSGLANIARIKTLIMASVYKSRGHDQSYIRRIMAYGVSTG
jgi:hypothetical protein